MIYLVLLIFAICLSHTQYRVAKFNLLAPWSGYGAIQGVLDKNSNAPMAYRVLVPWVIGRNYQLWKYELCQTILIYICLLSIYTAWDLSIVLITIILLTLTFWFDYWDWTLELTGLTLALVSFPLAISGVILLGLSRETAPLVGLVYALHSGNYVLGLSLTLLGLLVLVIVRAIQGEHKLYCKRWMILENIEMLKKGNTSAWISVGLCLISLLGAFQRIEGAFLVPVLIVAGWTMAKGNETRVFVGVVPYAALFISGLIR